MNRTLREVVEELSRPVPQPAQPRPITKKSWRRLRPNQWLRSRVVILGVPEGAPWHVVETTNLYAVLLHPDTNTSFKLSDPEWEQLFERSTKRGKRK